MARVTIDRHRAGSHDALSPRIEPQRGAGRHQAQPVISTPLRWMVYARGVVPMQIKVGYGPAQLGHPVVQHTVTVDMRAIQQLLRRPAPGLIPIGAQVAEIAPADAA